MNITTFCSFDLLIDAFVENTGLSLPRMTLGRSTFLTDLGKWATKSSTLTNRKPISYILPNPSQGLSFPTPIDVIASALLLSNGEHSEISVIHQKMLDYGLPILKGTQPVTSLSGGEILLLNYAKMDAMSNISKNISACSPTYWLNKNKYHYWDKLIGKYSDGVAEIFLMEGEPFPSTKNDDQIDKFKNIAPVNWNLSFDKLMVVFEEIQFPTYHPETSITFEMDKGNSLELAGPTLLTGDNGIGKSIFSKVLAEIIKSRMSVPKVMSPNSEGRVRLLFQNPINQLFAKDVDEHQKWVFRFSPDLNELVNQIKVRLLEHLSKYLDYKDLKQTLLQAKVGLISERLASKPSLLILDEPGWGLSKKVGRQLIWAACNEASSLGIPMMFISHRPDWWKGLLKSHIHLAKTDDGTVKVTKMGWEIGNE